VAGLPVLDLRPPVRLDLWALMLALGVLGGTAVPPLSPMLVLASVIVSMGVLVWRELVPAEWWLMAILAPLFAACGVGIALVHATTPDPLAELAALEPGEVVVVGKIASPPVPSGYGYRADLRVEHLWHHNKEVVRGGGVEVFAVDLSGLGVGDRVRVDGEISLPEPGEDGFDYARYLGTNSKLLTGTPSPKAPLTSRSPSGRTTTSSRSILYRWWRSSGVRESRASGAMLA
jgi:competence protein ComEC